MRLILNKSKYTLLVGIIVFSFQSFSSSATPPSEGLVGFWKFDEGTGSSALDSSGTNHGALINSPSWNKDIARTGLSFDGINDQVKVLNADSLSRLTSVTLSAWIHPRSGGGAGAGYGRILSKSDNTYPTASRYFIFMGSDNSSLGFNAGFTTTTGSWKTPSESLPLYGWHHIVVTYTHSVGVIPKIYIDGVLQPLTTLASPAGVPVNDDEKFYIGSRGINNNVVFDGVIDQVRVYNRQLAPEEINNLYNFEIPIKVTKSATAEMVFDWSESHCEELDIPDAATTAFRDDNGMVNLISTHYANYRMTGPSLSTVKRDCAKIMSSREDTTWENATYYEWIAAAYTLDGKNVYGLVHNEWYPFVAEPRCIGTNILAGVTNSTTMVVSTNGGATFQHPLDYKVWMSPIPWDSSFSCNTAWGAGGPTSIVKKGDYYYSIHSQMGDPAGHIAAGTGGSRLMRTNDLTRGSAWEEWNGTGWDTSLSAKGIRLLPRRFGAPMSLTYNTYLGAYIILNSYWDNRGYPSSVYYVLSQDLVNWTLPVKLVDIPEPGGGNYPSLLDPTDPSRNFEMTGQNPYLYYQVTDPARTVNLDRDLKRVRIHFEKTASFIQLPPPQAPGLNLITSSNTIPNGSSTTINWTSTNTVPSCTASGAWSGSKTTSGSQSVSPTSTSTYTLSCIGPGGSTSKSVTITVLSPPLR